MQLLQDEIGESYGESEVRSGFYVVSCNDVVDMSLLVLR